MIYFFSQRERKHAGAILSLEEYGSVVKIAQPIAGLSLWLAVRCKLKLLFIALASQICIGITLFCSVVSTNKGMSRGLTRNALLIVATKWRMQIILLAC